MTDWNGVRVCLLLAGAVSSLAGEGPVVKTSQGAVRGALLKSRGGREYAGFSGIPFAEPPLGSLRFMPPVPAKPWSEVLDATSMLPICYQISPYEFGQEDCLYLNIITPNLKPAKPLPVIFYVHFGGFVKGFSGGPDVGDFFMDEDVVVVFPHYRLGIFGFLSLENDELPGNQGMKDLALALEWTAREVGAFGGDPKQITVMGLSAGAAAAEFLAVSPRTSKLVVGCISMSGTGSASWSINKPGHARSVALQLGKELGCPKPEQMVACLQAKTAKEVIIDSIQAMGLGLVPVIEPKSDGAVITEWPQEDRPKFPWIIGNTANEGILQAGYLEYYEGDSSLKPYIENWQTYLPDLLGLENAGDAKKIHDRYFTKDRNPYKAVELLHGDAYFIYPALKAAKHHDGPKYFYIFNYTGGPTLYDMRLNKKQNGVEQGVCHGDDSFYVLNFHGIFTPEGWPSSAEVGISRNLIRHFVNFAKAQKPSSDLIKTEWPDFSGEHYYYVGNDAVEQRKYTTQKEIMDFWDPIKYNAMFKYHNW